MLSSPIGTGPYLPESLKVGVKAVLVRNAAFDWWGYKENKGGYIDRLEFIDLGTDENAIAEAFRDRVIDLNWASSSAFSEKMNQVNPGHRRSDVVSGATIIIRPNQKVEIYKDRRVRQALAMAVDNQSCLDHSIGKFGIIANNCHVGAIHPEHDPSVLRMSYDPKRALELLKEAGASDFEHELTSIDDDWRKTTTDNVASQLFDAGIKVKRTVLPGSSFWKDWTSFPLSSTNWAHRPLGIQTLNLAYRSGETWNESGFSNQEFDLLLAKASSIADAVKRRQVMRELQLMLIHEGVMMQPYWRIISRHHDPRLNGVDMHISGLAQIYKWSWNHAHSG